MHRPFQNCQAGDWAVNQFCFGTVWGCKTEPPTTTLCCNDLNHCIVFLSSISDQNQIQQLGYSSGAQTFQFSSSSLGVLCTLILFLYISGVLDTPEKHRVLEHGHHPILYLTGHAPNPHWLQAGLQPSQHLSSQDPRTPHQVPTNPPAQVSVLDGAVDCTLALMLTGGHAHQPCSTCCRARNDDSAIKENKSHTGPKKKIKSSKYSQQLWQKARKVWAHVRHSSIVVVFLSHCFVSI